MRNVLKVGVCCLLLTVFSCKKKGETSSPAANTSNTSTSVSNSGKQLGLVDITTLTPPRVKIARGRFCDAEIFKIQIDSADNRTDYFEFRICDPNNPDQCQPPTNASASFIGRKIELPNLLDNIEKPLIQIRSCLRTYNTLDPKVNCDPTWTSFDSVFAIKTKKAISELMWQQILDSNQITAQCISLRQALDNFNSNMLGQNVPQALADAVADGLAIGVNICTREILNGLFEAVAAEIQKKLAVQGDTNTQTAASSSTIAATDEDSASSQNETNASSTTNLMASTVLAFFYQAKTQAETDRINASGLSPDEAQSSAKVANFNLNDKKLIGQPLLDILNQSWDSIGQNSGAQSELFNALNQMGSRILLILGDLKSLQQQADACKAQ